MKKILIQFLLVSLMIPMFINSANAQLIRLRTIKEIKQSQVVVILTEDEELNKYLKNAIEKFWDLNEVIDYLPEDEAYELASKGDKIVTLGIGIKEVISSNRGHGPNTYRYISEGLQIQIKRDKNSSPIMNQFIPKFGESLEFSEVFIAFGVSTLNYTCKFMIENNLKTNMWLYNDYNRYADISLKDHTLLLVENWLHEKASIEDIKRAYKAPVEVTQFIDWKEAILEKKAGMAYSIVVPVPAGSAYIYMHYLVNCETGIVFGIARPKATVALYDISLTKSNSGYIDKKNMKAYNKIIK